MERFIEVIEEIRRRIRQEKEAAEQGVQWSQGLDESTDSDLTITYEEAGEQEEVGPEDRGAVEGRPKRLSPKQRHRRQSLARYKKKQWGQECLLQL